MTNPNELIKDELHITAYRMLVKTQWYPRDLGPVEYCLVCGACDLDGHKPSCELKQTIDQLVQTPAVAEYLRDKYPFGYDDVREEKD